MPRLFKAIPVIAAFLIALIPIFSNAVEQSTSSGDATLSPSNTELTGVRPVMAASADTDGDGIPDESDNCPLKFNPSQEDRDFDGVGDSCDNCPFTANPSQADADLNGVGDACQSCCRFEGDFNHDGRLNILDVMAYVDYSFRGGPIYVCKDEADYNDNGSVAIVDLTAIVAYLFQGAPFQRCP